MVTSTKCPNCGGMLIFDVDSQKLSCTHCSSLINIEDDNKKLEKKIFNQDATIALSETEYTEYLCNTCGREHVTNTDNELLRCPSCGDANLTKTNKIDFVPDGIETFKINKQTAINKLKSWLSRQKFAPNNLKKQAKSDSLTGVYIPTYIYDFNTTSHYSGVGVKSYRRRNGSVSYTRQFFNRTKFDKFVDYMDSATPSISSSKLRGLGHFSTSNILVYRPEYLYGWFGEAVKISLQDSEKNVRRDVANDISRNIQNSLSYDRIENFSCNTRFSDMKYSYVYLPIYKGTYKYNSKTYSYYVNGENGRVTGSAPKSKWKMFFSFLGIAAIIGGIIYLIARFG